MCVILSMGCDFMNGLLVIDKPSDFTSRDVVNIVGKKFNTRKVGHAGTLDPIATGVLVVALGTGLKILEYINNDRKEYIATVKMGIETDTLDVSGNIIKEVKIKKIDKEKLSKVVNSFKGKYLQEVPIYSSVKVNGLRLYKYARENKEVDLPKREVEIFDIELLNYSDDLFTFKVSVSKGTYIRSLIRDIGKKLNVLCTMKELRRTRHGDFTIDEAISLEQLKNDDYKLIPLDRALPNIHFIVVDSYIENKIKDGCKLENRYSENIIGFKNKNGDVLAIYEVYDKDNSRIKPIKVFNQVN